MAVKNATWSKVLPGQIISFVYKSQGKKSRGYKRTIILINPDWKYRKKSTGRVKRYVVGIQINTAKSPAIPAAQLKRILENVSFKKGKGELEFEDGGIGAKLPDDRMSKQETKRIYKNVKKLVQKFGNYRTFDRRECLKRRVFLELNYSKLPDQMIQEAEQDNLKEMMRLSESET